MKSPTKLRSLCSLALKNALFNTLTLLLCIKKARFMRATHGEGYVHRVLFDVVRVVLCSLRGVALCQ